MQKKSLLACVLGCCLAFGNSANAFADTLKVGTHPTFAPFEFSDAKGKVIGFDLDVIKAIAKLNGDKVQIESMPFDGLIPSLLTGNIDLIISGMTITDARKQRVDFTEGYYDSKLSILIKKDKEQAYKSAQDLKDKVICTQIGTTGHAFAQSISSNVKALNNQPDALMELNNGGCEALINDQPVNLYYLKKSKLENLVNFVDPAFQDQVDSFGIAVRKGNEDLLKKLNASLKKLEENGELDKLHMKWFGTSLKAAQAPVTTPTPNVDPNAPVAVQLPANINTVNPDAPVATTAPAPATTEAAPAPAQEAAPEATEAATN